MTQKTKNVIRWILLLPGAVVGSFLATFPLHWVLLIFAKIGIISEINSISTELNLYPLVIALTFVLGGSYIAPKYKLKTAIVLTVLYFVIFISLFLFKHDSQLGIRNVGALIGLLAGLCITWKVYGRR